MFRGFFHVSIVFAEHQNVFRDLDIIKRIHRHMVAPEFQMQMTAGRGSGRADIADQLAFFDDITGLDDLLDLWAYTVSTLFAWRMRVM